MAPELASPKTIFRNLALAVSLCFVLSMFLSGVPLLAPVAPLRVPLLVGAALLWAAWYVVRSAAAYRQSRRLLVTSQGPGGELTMKATLRSFAEATRGALHDDEGAAASVAAAAEVFCRAEQLYAASRFDQAAGSFAEAARTWVNLPAYLNWGNALLNISDYQQAEEVLGRGLQLAERATQPDFAAAMQVNLGVLHLRQGKLEEARDSLEAALSAFCSSGDERAQAGILVDIGHIHAHWGNWEEVKQDYATADRIFRRCDHLLGRANLLASLGHMHATHDRFDEAQESHRKALKLHEQLDNPLGLAGVHTYIGNGYFRENRLQRALLSYEEAMDLHRELRDPLGEASALVNMGNVQFRKGRLDEALQLYDRALETHKRIVNPLGQANVLTNIGSVLSRQGLRQEALEVLEQARAIYREVGAVTRGLDAAEELIARLRRRRPEDGEGGGDD